MTTFQTLHETLLACPNCHEFATVPKVGTCNGCSYTDGVWTFWDPNALPAMLKCRRCCQLVWMEDAMHFDTPPQMSFWARWRMRTYKPALEQDYYQGLELGLAAGSLEKEVVLRTHAWWVSNDSCRGLHDKHKPSLDKRSVQWKRNLESLPALRRQLQDKAAAMRGVGEEFVIPGFIGFNEALIRSDIFRQLGRFSEAVGELADAARDSFAESAPELHQAMVAYHRQLAEQGNIHVQLYPRLT